MGKDQKAIGEGHHLEKVIIMQKPQKDDEIGERLKTALSLQGRNRKLKVVLSAEFELQRSGE